MEAEDKDLYFPLLRRFRSPLIAGKEKKKWEKYRNMFHVLSKFKGCTSLLVSVRGNLVQTTLTNKVTADYINFYFWGMVVKTRLGLKDMDIEDDLICLRMSTSYYECTVTTGGVFEKSDYMIFTTQHTPNNISRPIFNLRRLLVQQTTPCDFPVKSDDPVPSMRQAIADMEKYHEAALPSFEKKKIAFLAAASAQTDVKESASMMSFAMSSFSTDRGSIKKPAVSFFGRDTDKTSVVASKPGPSQGSQSVVNKSQSKVSKASVATGSMASTSASFTSEGKAMTVGSKSETKQSTDRSKPSSKQQIKDKKLLELRKERYDWIKIDKDDRMVPPEKAPLYERTTSEESEDEKDDDIGYWRKRQDKNFTIFAADGTVIQDEVQIGFKPTSGDQFPPRKWTSKKARKEMVFKKRQTNEGPTEGNLPQNMNV